MENKRHAPRKFFGETFEHWPIMSVYERFEQIVAIVLSLVISVVIALASCSWSSASLALTTRALQRALAVRHPPPGLMFHSDRGVEYVAYAYQSLLKTHGITASLSRPYTCLDNAHMESFFHSLKAELLHRRDIHSDGLLNAMLAGYIERFYNSRRLHSSLGYYSPVEFEVTFPRNFTTV